MENEVNVQKRFEEIKSNFTEFKEKVAEMIKDLHVDSNEWSISINNNQEQMIVDLSVKLILKHKKMSE
ncbi:MAG: hypothetical protein P8Y18_05180 [Candidatus Bathyarchaeota archaeon]